MSATDPRAEIEWAMTALADRMTKFPRSRKRRRCETRAFEANCRGIDVGDRYARTGFPPGSEPFGLDTWSTFIECETCSNWYGRPFPPEPNR